MELIADALLIAGAVGAAIYCRALARRLGALRDMDSGLGAAIAALSRQVDEMRNSLEAAKSISGDQTREIGQLTARAEMAAGRLELLLASLHEGGERRSVGRQSTVRRAERDEPPVHRGPGWRGSDGRNDEADMPQTPDEVEERAAVEAVLRSLSRNRTEDGERPANPMPGRRAPDARKPSIFADAFDDEAEDGPPRGVEGRSVMARGRGDPSS
jgi:hypothetical protein